jgi:F-type H+-transporting ATPase subunit b
MEELIKHFGIDLRLLLAQAVNFFILLFILWRFAYRPILKILKTRKREIEKGLEFTKKAEEELRKTEVVREETSKKARNEALGIVSQAEGLGKQRKEELVRDAHKKAESVIIDAKRAIEEEKAKMGERVHKDARELVRSGIAKILGRMPAGERDEHLIEEALKELRSR